MLRELEKQTTLKSCDLDMGGCGRMHPMQLLLQGAQPRCFALQLVWETGQESAQDIRDTLDIVREVGHPGRPVNPNTHPMATTQASCLHRSHKLKWIGHVCCMCAASAASAPCQNQVLLRVAREQGVDITSCVQVQELDLGQVYVGADEGEQCLRPRSMVCYYGLHYHAFVRVDGQWLSFDDATSSVVGAWADVVRKCELGKIQPSVLFFEAA